MGLQIFRTKPGLPYPVACRPLLPSHAGPDLGGLCEERSWRRLAEDDESRAIEADILVSRWVDSRTSCRYERAVSSPDRHIIGVALKTTRLKLTRGPLTIFDGIMPAGTLHVTGPSQSLAAEFYAPCDFIHFHVASDYLRKRQLAARSDLSQPIRELNDLIIRDPLAEMLGRTLIERGSAGDSLYAESVGQTLVMHIARLEPQRPTVNALPKWRLKRVQEHIDAHLDESISLADLARVAGLSRMHFAAQFRAATGYRPHDYLLFQRIESAKSKLSSTDMPLAEIALAVGFQAQAHFSTVFKRLTGETPARWRCSVIRDRHPAGTPGRPAAIKRANQITASM
jgi:AraC family transcriptional regulator